MAYRYSTLYFYAKKIFIFYHFYDRPQLVELVEKFWCCKIPFRLDQLTEFKRSEFILNLYYREFIYHQFISFVWFLGISVQVTLSCFY